MTSVFRGIIPMAGEGSLCKQRFKFYLHLPSQWSYWEIVHIEFTLSIIWKGNILWPKKNDKVWINIGWQSPDFQMQEHAYRHRLLGFLPQNAVTSTPSAGLPSEPNSISFLYGY